MVMTMRNIKGKPKGSNVKTFVLGITAFLLLILLAQPVAANVGVAFQQCSNNNHQALGTCDWINSILQDHNSVYFEGMSTPQRVVLTDIAPVTGNTHSLGFHMEASKGADTHAYDYPTSWHQAQLAANAIQPTPALMVNFRNCGDLKGADLATCTAIEGGADSISPSFPDDIGDIPTETDADPDDSANSIAAYEGKFGDRTLTIYGDQPIDSASVTFLGYTGTDPTGNYLITWHSSSTKIVIEFAGHLAMGADFLTSPLGTGDIGYGVGEGSSDINGGPYHIPLDLLDGSVSLGNQDNQIQGASILMPPPQLRLIKIVDNTNGGTKQPADWTLSATGTTGSFSDSGAPVGFHMVNGGVQYTLSESPNPGAGYSTNGTWSCDNGTFVTPNKITLQDGFQATCRITNVANPTPVVHTQVHNTVHADITNTAVPLGSVVHDNASLTGGNSPTGTITYGFFVNGDCSGSPTSTQTVALGTESSATSALAAGSYGYLASYSGDAHNNAATGVCEPFTVSKAQLTVVTTIKNAANDQPVTGPVPLGTSVYDNATVTGAVPGFAIGTVSYTFRTDDGACATDGVAAGTGGKSTVEGPLGAGAYSFDATVAGNANYLGDTSDCEPLTVEKAQLTIVTTIKNAANDQPVTGPVPLGTSVYDNATVTGMVAGFDIGTVSYTWRTDDGACATDGVAAGTGGKSTVEGPLGAGAYSFDAAVAGDDNYLGDTSDCEPLTVNKAQLTIVTTIKNAANDQPVTGPVPLGTSVYDNATVTGMVAGFDIGTVSYTWRTDDGACATDGVSAGTGGKSTVEGPLGAGAYSFDAAVAGDDNYLGDTSDCEPLTVNKAQLTIVTTIKNAANDQPVTGPVPLGTSVYDNATVTGMVAGFDIGTVSYTWRTDDGACATDGVSAGTGGKSTVEGPLGAGAYSFDAAVAGDDNYLGDTSDCEPLTVNKAQLTIVTTIKNAANDQPVTGPVPLGTSVYDNATVTGMVAGFDIGTVSYTWRTDDGACATDGVSAGTGGKSTVEGPLGAGAYSFDAAVAGDDNYLGDTSDCEPLTVNKAQLTIVTTIKNAANDQPVTGPVPLGTSVYDNATVTGMVAGFDIGTVSYTWRTDDGACATDGVSAGTGGKSTVEGPLGAGAYSFDAAVAGDDNYLGDTSDCEPLTVNKAQLTIVTTIKNAANDQPVTGPVPLGTSVYDNATVTGMVAGFDIGTVSYTWRTDDGACATDGVSAGTGGKSTVEGPLGAGAYSFDAAVAGDDNYLGDTSDCEPLTVEKAQLTIVTTIKNAANDQPVTGPVPLGTSVYDNATVTGMVAGFDIGTVSYTFRTDDGACATDGVSAGTGGKSTVEGPLGAGAYSFDATVAGDDNYLGDTSDCEPLTVEKANLGFTTAILDSSNVDVTGQTVPAGTVVHDTSALTGQVGTFIPSGTVDYVFNGGLPEQVTVSVTGTVPDSSATGALSAGDYTYTATYSGDDNYFGLAATNIETVTVFTPPTGCTGTIGYWAGHPCAMVLPQTLGLPLGSKSNVVDTTTEAVSIERKIDPASDGTTCNQPSNGIVMMDAQLLAVKLAQAQTGATSTNATFLAALVNADAFRATHDCNDWSSLTTFQKQQVNAWESIFDMFNNGLLGPGHCATTKCPAVSANKITIQLGGGL